MGEKQLKSLETVVILDDDIEIVAAYCRNLRIHFTIRAFNSSLAALSELPKLPRVAVIVTDNKMPDLSGLEFLKKSRAIHPNAARIMVTANLEGPMVDDAIKGGLLFRFFEKPCPTDTVIAAINDGLAYYHRRIAGKT